MDKDLINDYRAIVLPVLQNVLIKTNYQGRGISDALDLEKDFNEILRLAEKALDSQWIPVSERLPEENGEYLVTREAYLDRENRNMVFVRDIASFTVNHGLNNGFHKVNTVIA